MTNNWYQMSCEDAAKKLKSSRAEGLTRAAAKALLRKHGKNTIYPVSKLTFYNCIKSMTMDYTSYLLIATALIAAVFEQSVGAWTLVTLLAVNLIATLLIYTKSQKMLESMDRYTLPVVRVVRDGRLFMIDQKQLVPGDLICLSRGDIVPADARLMTDSDLWVDETRLFGRSARSLKQAEAVLHETLPPEKQRNMVFASTLIESGEAMALVCETGEDTVVCITEKNRPIITHESMPLLGQLGKISRVWSLVVIGAVFFLTLFEFLMPGLNHSLFVSFMQSMSLAVSAMSEMYVAFGYIVLACAVFQTVQMYREAGSGAIIKNPLCMDKLRHITCLVVPKEGVFTTRDTVADRVFAGDRLYDMTDRHARRAMERPILYAILSTGMYGTEYLQKSSRGRLSQTEEETALLNLARRMDIYNVRLDRAYPMLDHRAAGGDSLFDTTLVSHKDNVTAVSRGEPEALLSRCAYYYKDGRIMLLTPEVRSAVLISYRKLVRQAYSVIGVASHTYIYNNLKFIGAAQKDMVFEGFIAFRVPYLRGVGQLVSDAKEAGIKIILLSERPAAAEAYFAKQIGIVEGRETCIDGSTLHGMKEGIRRTNASYYRLYCGLDETQKQELLTYLHEDGEVVGVLGRKQEELSLLRAADVSFAQNITVQNDPRKKGSAVSKVSERAAEAGCEALKFESDIIVSDATRRGTGGFRAMLEAIAVAKNTDMNIIRTVRYLIMAQTARFLLVLYTVLFSKEGMTAVQTLFSGLFMDFMSVLVLAFQRPSPDILRTGTDAAPILEHPLKKNLPSVCIGVCWACAAVLASFFSGLAGFASTEGQAGSVLFFTSALLSVLMLFSVQKDEFIWRPGVRMSALHTIYLLFMTEIFLLFFLFPPFGALFGVVKFDIRGLLVIGIVSAMTLIFAECVKMLSRLHQRPDLVAAEEENEEQRSHLVTLFQKFRDQKEQEAAQPDGSVSEDAGLPETKAGQSPKDRHGFFALFSKKNAPDTEEMAAYVKKQRAGRKQKKQQSQEKPVNPLFAEDENELDDLFEKRSLPEDDALSLALKNSRAAGEENTEAEAGEAGPADRPDPEAFAAAEAEDSLLAGLRSGDITVGGTDAEVRGFLRTEAPEDVTEEEAEREFPGIGYLFSESEYEAIMAEYNRDGTKTDIYNTDTQKIDPVPKKGTKNNP